jgi:hypothetical protein
MFCGLPLYGCVVSVLCPLIAHTYFVCAYETPSDLDSADTSTTIVQMTTNMNAIRIRNSVTDCVAWID